MDIKDYLIELLDLAIKDNDDTHENENQYDISFLEEILKKTKEDGEYFQKFILDIDNNTLASLSSNIDSLDEQKSFAASALYIQKLLELNEKEGINIPLSDNQNQILSDLLNIIKTIVDNYYEELNDSQKKHSKKSVCEELKNKLINNQPLNKKDYDLVERIIYKYENGDSDNAFDEAMTFLNEYNYNLLAPKEEVEVVEEPVKEEVSEEVVEEKPNVKEKKPKAKKNKKEKKVEPKPTAVLPVETNISYDIDIFSPQSFELQVENKKDTPEISINDLLNELNIKYEELSSYSKNILEEVDIKIFKDNIYYIKDNIQELFNNNTSIIYIAAYSSVKVLNDALDYFKKIELLDVAVQELFNRCTHIFNVKNYNNFEKNIKLALKYKADINILIKENITFFYNSAEYNKNKIELLEKNGLDPEKIFKDIPILLAFAIDVLLKNLGVLKMYNYDLKEADYHSLTILASKNLNKMIDVFIEAGFSNYIGLVDGIKNTKSLIIKRIFYAIKNDLSVWNENINEDRLESEFEEIINNERVLLTDEEIGYLISDYMLLEAKLENKRPSLFNNTEEANNKRRLEFRFNNNIISRLKTYSIFKTLINHDIDLNIALFYALTYNSSLTNEEYKLIKNEIIG